MTSYWWKHLAVASKLNGETPWFFVAVMATAMEVACAAGILILKGKYKGFIGFSFVISAYCYFGLLLYCFVIHRHVPQKCLGNLGKLMFDLIATSAAMALCQILGFDIFSLLLLVGFTVNLHVVAQSLHRAYDVSMWDVLFGSIMQIVVYTLWQDKYMVTVVLLLLGGVLFYRYASYSPPVMPVDMKQSDKQLC